MIIGFTGHRDEKSLLRIDERFPGATWLPVALSCYLWPSWGVVAFWALVFVGQCCVDAVHLWLDGLL